MADPKGPALVIAIGKKPPGADDPSAGGEQGGDDAAYGQHIVDEVRKLPPDDLAKLFSGIDPGAQEVMEKIACLAPLADFLENGGKDDQPDTDDQDQAPAPNGDVRSSVEMAMRKNMPAGGAGY